MTNSDRSVLTENVLNYINLSKSVHWQADLTMALLLFQLVPNVCMMFESSVENSSVVENVLNAHTSSVSCIGRLEKSA